MNKIICVSNKVDLLNRSTSPSGPFYKVKCDNGDEKHIYANRFRELTLAEKRKIKINKILK
jgi:hypothetical protein